MSTHRAHVSNTLLTTSRRRQNCPHNSYCCCCTRKSMIKNWFCRKWICNIDFKSYALSHTIPRKSILHAQAFLKLNNPKKQQCWVFFSSPERAHTEHVLGTRFWRHRNDDEIAHTTIIIIMFIAVPDNIWLNIEFAANAFSTLMSRHMHCQIQLIGLDFT